MKSVSKVNVDLQKERNGCAFDIQELTNIIDGGEEKHLKRKKIESILLAKKDEVFSGTPIEYLSHKEKYEEAVRKAIIVFGMGRTMQETHNSLEEFREFLHIILGLASSLDGSPFGVHYIMFLPVFLNQASEDQQALWFPRAWSCSIIGSYAQTELGHGTFIRGLETTATYDENTQEFILHSPTLTSYKWWPGGLGQTANYCIVIAQLHTKGKCYGIHSFIVQVRCEESHMPLPGIKVGDIGAKLGMNSVNNGFLGFDQVRIPRTHMLMKHAQVLEDGTYVKSKNSKLNYGAMVFVRVVIVFDMVNYLSKAVTTAVRYSAVRRQSQLKQSEPECQILDFTTQQHKLFIAIATCHALKVTGNVLWATYNDVNKQLHGGNLDKLSELHALACCLKAVSTSDSATLVERCRLACGGHGYMLSSNLPQIYGLVTAACTYEGDNTVLLLQTARFLVKTWRQMDSVALTPTVAYLKMARAEGFADKWSNTVDGIIQGFQIVAMRKISTSVNNMENRVRSGMSLEDAWNSTSVQLVAAAELHCRVIVISTFNEEVAKLAAAATAPIKRVFNQLVELYAIYWALKKSSDLLRFTCISENDVKYLQTWYEQLLTDIRPNAVGLIDAFDIEDELLSSTLGSYDGRVYERLMEEALKSPLNQEPVNQSFHTYLKPFMQGKL